MNNLSFCKERVSTISSNFEGLTKNADEIELSNQVNELAKDSTNTNIKYIQDELPSIIRSKEMIMYVHIYSY